MKELSEKQWRTLRGLYLCLADLGGINRLYQIAFGAFGEMLHIANKLEALEAEDFFMCSKLAQKLDELFNCLQTIEEVAIFDKNGE